jgi:hypothetical protein
MRQPAARFVTWSVGQVIQQVFKQTIADLGSDGSAMAFRNALNGNTG